MNKNLINFLSFNGLSYDKNTFFGSLNGFQVSGACIDSNINISVNVHIPREESGQIDNWISTNRKFFSLNGIIINENGISCTIAGFNSAKKCINYLTAVTDFLSTVKAPNACPFCGKLLSEDVRLVGIGYNKMNAHEKCFDDYSDKIKNNEIIRAAAPNNYLKGTFGAILGCLAGCVLWIILSFVGYIAIVAAIIASLGAALLWDTFGGKNDKIKIVVVWIVSIVMIALSIFITYLIIGEMAIIYAVSEYGSVITTNPLEALIIYFENDKTAFLQFIFELIISFVFVVAGNTYTTLRIIQSQKLTSATLIKY